MQKYTDVVQDINGNAVSGASVTIKTSPAAATATIYSDNGVTTQTNPITTDSDGRFTFYAKDGNYYASVSKTGITGEDGPVFTLRDTSNCVNVLGYGAIADGGAGSGTDSSAAFTAALAAANTVIVPPGNYSLKDVTIPSGKTLIAWGAYFYDRAGAAYVFNLTGYSSKLIGAYISSATNCSVGAIVIDNGRASEVFSTCVVNATSGIVLKATTAATGCIRTQLVDVYVDTYTGVGLDVQANVSETNAVNVYLDAGAISGGGALIPHTGATGVKQLSTGSVVAFGGHRYTGVTVINCETGWVFTDTNLTTLSNCIADSCSGIGLKITDASSYLDFEGMFIGSCGRGVQISQTSSKITFTGLRTILNGVIPSWGGTTFYSSGGYSATFYDMVLFNTSSATIDADTWWGDKSTSVASGCTLNVTGGEIMRYCTAATVAAGATVYLGQNTESATESFVQFVVPYACSAFTMYNVVGSAPGAAKSFTYTLRKNGVDTTLIGTITGAGVFASTIAGGPATFAAGDVATLKLVTDAASAVTTHRGYVQFLQRSS